MSSERRIGKVKFFDNKKGLGFIEGDGEFDNDQGKPADILMHYKEIRMEGFKVAKKGWTVEYTLVMDPKGARAKDIVIIDRNEDD